MISNKQKVNIFIVLLIIVICSLLLINKNQKENFTVISKLNYLQGPSGNVGPQGNIGNQGIEGTVGQSFEINDINLYLKNKLTLGTKELVYVTKSDTGDYSQLKLSKKIKKNGAKLKMSKNDFDDESMYIHSESNNETDFYINNKKMYMNGNIEINGNLTVQNNDLFHSFPKDIIPIGTIFPFYFENANKNDLNSGYYKLGGYGPGSLFYIEKISADLYFIRVQDDSSSTEHDFKHLYYDETNNSLIYDYKNEDSNKFIIKYTGTGDDYNMSPYTNPNKFLDVSTKLFNSSSNNTVTITPDIPYGWKICDGDSTTINVPNLNDKMVVGKDNNNYMFSSVGSNTSGTTNGVHTIDCDPSSSPNACEMPIHNHQISTYGSHTHDFDEMIQIDNNHKHPIRIIIGNDDGFNSSMNYSFVGAAENASTSKTIISTEESHNHEWDVQENGGHNHNKYTSNDRLDTAAAAAVPINIEPNYMKLVYIIKVI
jgi:hypothetical protein